MVEGISEIVGHRLVAGDQAQGTFEPPAAVNQLHRLPAVFNGRGISLQLPGFEYRPAIAELGTKQFRIHLDRLFLVCRPRSALNGSGRSRGLNDRRTGRSCRLCGHSLWRRSLLDRNRTVRGGGLLRRLRRRDQAHLLEQKVVTDDYDQRDDEEDDDAFFHEDYVPERCRNIATTVTVPDRFRRDGRDG